MIQRAEPHRERGQVGGHPLRPLQREPRPRDVALQVEI
jgi:hypothetical protein